MNKHIWLVEQFEENRSLMQAVAYRMLGSLNEAEDAVQEAWLRFNRADTSDVENMAAWLKTVVARVCLDMLRARRSRHEAHPDTYIPDPIVQPIDGGDPEHEALLAESVGLALLVVLETLPPAERLAFVLHDSFGVPFDEIAPIVGRTPTATRQLASRARRRVQGAAVAPDADSAQQRVVVDAFFAAARGGDFEALIAVLDPDVVLRGDGGTARPHASVFVRGASTVAKRALMFSQPSALLRPVSVNGAAGVLVVLKGEPFALMGFTVIDKKIAEIDVLADPVRLHKLNLQALSEVSA